MADISIHTEGEVTFQPTNTNCLMVNLSMDLEGVPYSRDVMYFHGSIESMREFARKMLAALPSEPERAQSQALDHSVVAEEAQYE